MPKLPNQKLKLLYLHKIFTQETDENHPISMSDIIKKLDSYGISAERKSIYDDINALNNFGMDICKTDERVVRYFNASSTFELAELKLLIDAVESSKFITEKKSVELIKKISSLASIYGASELSRQVYMLNRVKTLNERIYYNVDTIHMAISSNRQISFKYFDLDLDKTKKYRKNGEQYTENPVSLIWDDENYYLVCYNLKHDAYVHYRVDRMEAIKLLDLVSVTPKSQFNPADYLKKTFSMFSGREEMVTLKFDMSLVNVVFDRFGLDITPFKKDDNSFIINTKVNVSHQFYGWIASLGSRCTILSPQNVKDEFTKMLNDILNNHK